MIQNNHLIIMAGGVGSRFWPMSTAQLPKQFIDVLGVGRSLIQMTYDRFKDIIPIENLWVVTSKDYKEVVIKQLEGIKEDNILLEPCMRNTAPCIAYVTWKIAKKYPNANLVFSPADHIVLDTIKFAEVINNGLTFSANSNNILTLGMHPTRPETGYGYILSNGDESLIQKVEAFKEKPNLEIAKEYIQDKRYFWNAGIFIWNSNTVKNSFRKLVPDIATQFDKLEDSFYTEDEQDRIDIEFPNCKNISIDYAIMEKSDNVYVYPASFGWSDLGTWGSLYTHLEKDFNSNAIVGDNINLVDSKYCIVHLPESKKAVIQGLDNYIIAEKDNTLLICKLQDEQLIKEWQK